MKTTYECLSCGWEGAAPALADEAGVLGELLRPVRCCPQCGEEVRLKDTLIEGR